MFVIDLEMWPSSGRGGLASQPPAGFLVLDDIAKKKRPLLPKLFLKRGMNTLREWFNKLDSTRANKRGWPRQHFWKRVADSVRIGRANNEGGSLEVREPGVAIKITGGEIRPKRAQNLAIPETPEAYGKSPRDFPDLVFIKNRFEEKFLAKIETDGGTTIYFMLAKRVRVNPEPNIMPDEETWKRGMGDEFENYLNTTELNKFAPLGDWASGSGRWHARKSF